MNGILVFFGEGWFEGHRKFVGVTASVDPLGHLILTATGGVIAAAFAPGVWTGFAECVVSDDGVSA